MPFKLDAINKVNRVLKELYQEKPHLALYGQDNIIEYFKDIVPLLHERLNDYEINVMIEFMCLNIAETYNDRYYKIKKIYDSIVLFKVDPIVVIGEFFDEIKGFSGFTG